MTYTIQHNDGQQGVFSLEQIRLMAQAGQLQATDLAWAQGSTTPVTVATLLQNQSDATGGVVPYKNPQALTGYYFAVGSLIPCIGFPLGVVAFILGLKGLKRVKAEPWVRGTAHAWIAIIGGGLMALIWGVIIALVLIAPMLARK